MLATAASLQTRRAEHSSVHRDALAALSMLGINQSAAASQKSDFGAPVGIAPFESVSARAPDLLYSALTSRPSHGGVRPTSGSPDWASLMAGANLRPAGQAQPAPRQHDSQYDLPPEVSQHFMHLQQQQQQRLTVGGQEQRRQQQADEQQALVNALAQLQAPHTGMQQFQEQLKQRLSQQPDQQQQHGNLYQHHRPTGLVSAFTMVSHAVWRIDQLLMTNAQPK